MFVASSLIKASTIVSSLCFIQEPHKGRGRCPINVFPTATCTLSTRATISTLVYWSVLTPKARSQCKWMKLGHTWSSAERVGLIKLLSIVWLHISQRCSFLRSLLFTKTKLKKRSSFRRAPRGTMRFWNLVHVRSVGHCFLFKVNLDRYIILLSIQLLHSTYLGNQIFSELHSYTVELSTCHQPILEHVAFIILKIVFHI